MPATRDSRPRHGGSERFGWRSRAYHEIWLDQAPLDLAEAETEPLYGDTYLPRKFKIALAAPDDNSVDVLANDLGIIALFDGNALTGCNVALGGGLGMTHNKPATYPRLAEPLVFVAPEDLVQAVEAVIRMLRDHGDRSNRKHARLKYLVAEKGAAWTKVRLEDYFGRPLEVARPMPPFAVRDHLGWHAQGDGRYYLGLPVPSGRIADTADAALRRALREVVRRFGPEPILRPSQDILLGDIRLEDRDPIVALLRRHGVTLAKDMTPVARFALACPALPTCGLALTEAERICVPLIQEIESRLRRHGLDNERLSIRITGCPNGCARPYTGDIGIVGRMPGHYALFVGGDFAGTRLNFKLLDRVKDTGVPEVLDRLFGLFKANRGADEGFGDYCAREGGAALRRYLAADETAASEPAVA